jgi:CRP/FNR family transcriptional regulator
MNQGCKLCNIKSKAATKLSSEEIEKLSFNCTIVNFKKGDPLIKQGTFSTNVAYLKTGLAKIHVEGPYHEQVMRIVKAPSYLALPTTFGDKINQYSVTGIEESEVCFIDLETFRFLLKVNHEFSYEILLELCRNELDMYNRCANRTQKHIRGKVADVLIDFSEKIYSSKSFKLPLTQEDIGNLVDSSRESINRVLAEFDKDGIIKFTGKSIEIVNRETLRLISSKG